MKGVHFFVILFLSAFAVGIIQAEEVDQIAAQVGESQITMTELDALTRSDMQPVNIQIYNIRKAALKGVIEDHLWEQEAASLGISKKELLKQISDTARPVTEEDIQKYYEAKKARMKGDIEKVRPRIERYLKKRSIQRARAKELRRIRKETKITINLEAPRFEIPIPEHAITKGPEDAPVTIVVFTDFQCPYCKRGAKTLTEVFQEYPGKIRMIHRDFPLSIHKNGKSAANAARCANDQGEFWNYYNVLFENQGKLDDKSLIKHAAGLALDMDEFQACVDSNKYGKIIDSELAAGQAVGVRGTPAHYVNGRPLSGAVPLESFKEIIDEELEKL